MFMFRSRRNALVKRLWRQAALRRGGGGGGDDDDPTPGETAAEECAPEATSEEQQVKSWIKSAAHALFKRLTDDQLALLLDILDGASTSPCFPLDTDLVNRICPTEGIHRLLCRLFRWPELSTGTELKRVINLCGHHQSTTTICCNPYHWSRLSDVAPPPYTRLGLNHDRPSRLTNSYPVESLETGGTNQYSSTGSNLDGGVVRLRPWCTLAYWELRQRVGRLFPVTQPSVAIFSDSLATAATSSSMVVPMMPLDRQCNATSLCLSALTSQRPPETDAVRRTRQKVGLGLLLCQEPDGVWMYNRSENPVFVNSPTLDPPGTGPAGAPRTLLVYKVPPSFAIRVFDHERSLLYQQCSSLSESLTGGPPCYRLDGNTNSTTIEASGTKVAKMMNESRLLTPCFVYKEEYTDGPFDPNALRISFAKGWGPKYSRQFITSCPCWIEVLLAPSR
ncbi:mothers against decapentaplegic homolog 6-like [Daphnia pulicaria]|uniref:mothers against decapentaplegic homolog 6-like n=1 Tax=Daphnia pulicaria TaxID=35523 RepID=UPI001EECEEBA|nr:mothers against decapentaplegic homolog 6-like [Daphnia pulicaria]